MSTEVIVALDVDTVEEAWRLFNEVHASWFKVGLELVYTPGGQDLVKRIAETKNVFLDAKLSDIPTTVYRATKAIVTHLAPDILTVRNNVDQAMDAAIGSETWIAEVPFLTSDPGWHWATPSNANCIVCPPKFARKFRSKNPRAKIICPGIRLPGAAADDHIDAQGVPLEADYIVVGRPITRAKDPQKIFKRYSEAVA